MTYSPHNEKAVIQTGILLTTSLWVWRREKSDIAEVVSSKTLNTGSLSLLQPRALSLRNLVSGYECGRIFPAAVGPGSPSSDTANWLFSRFGLSVETRRQYGWLRMVFSGVRLFRAPIWWPSGGWWHTRGRELCHGELGSSLSGG